MSTPDAFQAQVAGVVRRLGRRCGWAGALGGGLIMLAIVAGTLGDRHAEGVRGNLARERARLMSAQLSERTGPVESDRARLEGFYTSRFPGESALGSRLGRLYAAAAEHGLEVSRVDYRIAAEPGTPLRRVALSLPVRGEFSRIHAWLGEVLLALPELALEGLSIRRAGSEVRSIEAELRLVIFVAEGR